MNIETMGLVKGLLLGLVIGLTAGYIYLHLYALGIADSINSVNLVVADPNVVNLSVSMCWMYIEETNMSGMKIGVYNTTTDNHYWRCNGMKEMCIKRENQSNETIPCMWNEKYKSCRCFP